MEDSAFATFCASVALISLVFNLLFLVGFFLFSLAYKAGKNPGFQILSEFFLILSSCFLALGGIFTAILLILK